MNEHLETIFTYDREDGRHIEVAVGPDRRLYVNGEPVVTDSRLRLNWWVNAAVITTGASTMALAVVEVGRAFGRW